jgi:hypothetical protein
MESSLRELRDERDGTYSGQPFDRFKACSRQSLQLGTKQ